MWLHIGEKCQRSVLEKRTAFPRIQKRNTKNRVSAEKQITRMALEGIAKGDMVQHNTKGSNRRIQEEAKNDYDRVYSETEQPK